MTASDIFTEMTASGTVSRDEIDQFFALLSTETLENQIAMNLTPNDSGTVYTTVDSITIEVIEQ